MIRFLLLFPLLFGFKPIIYCAALEEKDVYETSESFVNVARAAADSLPPVITCPPNDTLTLGSTSCDTAYTYTVTVEDDQPGALFGLVSGIPSGEVFPVGTTVNLFLAIDAAGNTATCSFTVTVENGPGEALHCEDFVAVKLGATCTATLTAAEMLESPLVCPGNYLVEVDETAPFGNGPWQAPMFDASDLGKTFQARVTDTRSGNKCWGNIKLVDSLPPALNCPVINVPCVLPSTHLTPAFLKDSLGIINGMASATDNCTGPAGITLTFVDMTANLPCDSPGTVTGYIHRIWTAKDGSGNTATCLQVINRQRNLADILFPADVSVSCDDPDTAPDSTGIPYVQVGGRQYGMLAAPFCEIDVFYFDSIETMCGGSRRIHRTWSAQDACLPVSTGNPVIAVQKIDVPDTDLPVLQCPQDTVIILAADSCTVALNLPDVIASDHCSPLADATVFWEAGGVTQTLGGVLENFSQNDSTALDTLAVFGEASDFPVGVTNLLFVVTDVCGNIGSCEITLNVWDDTAPAAVCDSLVNVYLDPEGQYGLSAAAADLGSTGDCGTLTFKIRRATAGPCAQPGTAFDDQQFFCCADAGDTAAVLVRVYDVFVPAGTVADSFAQGHYNDCTVLIAVLDTLAPACIAPADVTVFCSDFDPGLAAYGDITQTCQVDSIAVSADYAGFDSLCNSGTITRLFRVFDQAGNSGQCSQQIEVTEAAQEYWIHFPNDVLATLCNPDGIYGEPRLGNLHCENMSISYQDELITVVPDACYKIDRTWTIYNTCTYDPAQALVVVPNPNPNAAVNHPSNLTGPTVSPMGTATPWAPSSIAISPGQTPTNFSTFWSANANGYQYKQIIKIIDTQDPVIDQCPTAAVSVSDESPNDPQLWNEQYWYDQITQSHDLAETPVGLCLDVSDQCSGADVRVRFLLFLDLDGDGVQETVINSVNLPGPNTVNFGNVSNPNYSGGTPRAFDERPVTPQEQYAFALQTVASGNNKTACVKWNTQQSPLNYTEPQLPHGSHRIRWFTEDNCGNETICEYTFTVGPDEIAVGGQILTEGGQGVDVTTVDVTVNSAHPTLPPATISTQTDGQGDFQFSVPAQSSYLVRPKRDDDPLNGVSTFDLVLINKHVLGIDPLPSAYKIIAADANRSRSVTTFDIVELRKLILGITSKLPASESWRFVDKNYTFPNPANPFQEIYPEIQSVVNLSAADLPFHEFIGLKVGDVNGSVSPNVTDNFTDKRSDRPLYFDAAEQQFNPGDVFDVPVAASEPVAGFQFTLHFPGLEVVELLPGPGMNTDNFAIFNETETLTASWDSPLAPAAPAFTLRLRAKTAGRLSEQLRLSHRITRPEAYSPELELLDPALRFDGLAVQQPVLELFQNEPNPFSGRTWVAFYLPEAEKATLRVIDASGRERYARTAFYAAGLHRVSLGRAELGDTGGVLFLRLETAAGSVVRRMVFVR